VKNVVFMSIILTVFAFSSSLTGIYSNNKDVKRFINSVSARDHFSKAYLIKLFSKASKPRKYRVPRVYRKRAKGIARELRGARGYTRHEMLYLGEDRVRRGVAFANRYKSALDTVEKKFKVNRYIVAAILGIETYYGEIKGEWEVFNTLAYKAFKEPRNARTKLYRYELEKFLVFTRKAKLKPLYLKGSNCGAMGLGQLMPHSYMEYGVNFDGNRKIEPFSKIDSIATVANYLRKKGWLYGKNSYQINSFSSIFRKRAVLRNFRVLKKYNNSDQYAYVVLRLATILEKRLGRIALAQK